MLCLAIAWTGDATTTAAIFSLASFRTGSAEEPDSSTHYVSRDPSRTTKLWRWKKPLLLQKGNSRRLGAAAAAV